MLIDKGLQTGDIITIKLTSGEEIVAKMVEETDQMVKVSKPLVLAAGKNGIGMVPYLVTVDPDKDIKISRSTITVCELTEIDAAKQYIQGTTGLVT